MGTNDFMDMADFNFFSMFEELEKAPQVIKKELKRDMRKASQMAPDFYPEANWTPTPPERRP